MLSKNDIKKALASASGTRWITDSSEGYGRGSLVLKVVGGKKGTTAAWFVVWTPGGKIQRHRLGSYPDMSESEARDAYRDFDLQEPGKEREKIGGTVHQMFTAYIDTLQERGTSSADQLRRILLTGQNNVARLLGPERQAGEITAGDIALILQAIHANGKKRMADATRTAIGSAFNWAIQSRFDYTDTRARDWQIPANPVAIIKKDRSAKVARDRNLTVPEIAAVMRYQNKAGADVLKLILCCGQRVLETLRVEGCDLNLSANTWTMPAEKTKGGFREHVIPLPDQAVEIFTRLIEEHQGGYLFPAKGSEKLPHLSLSTINRMTGRIPGAEPFQPRDLRRTWKTKAADAGMDTVIRDRIQQHIENGTANKFYDRYDYMREKRKAMDVWQDYLSRIIVKEL